jgi:hypothetical protein
MPIDYTKLPSNRNASNVTVYVGPSGGSTLGITNIAVPLAVELNNTGGTSGVQPASQSISWNDWDFNTQASETLNEPSLADSASYEEFGQNNFGGSISFYYPLEYDDNSNMHSVIYDLTDTPGELNDIATRIDGDKPTTQAAADGDFVSAYRVEVGGEDNPFTPGESKRRTVSYLQKGEFAHYTIVGAHTITAIVPATTPWVAGNKARLRASVQSRDYTNALRFTTSDPDVVQIYPGGFYEVTGVALDTATITIYDDAAGTSATVSVTVT